MDATVEWVNAAYIADNEVPVAGAGVGTAVLSEVVSIDTAWETLWALDVVDSVASPPVIRGAVIKAKDAPCPPACGGGGSRFSNPKACVNCVGACIGGANSGAPDSDINRRGSSVWINCCLGLETDETAFLLLLEGTIFMAKLQTLKPSAGGRQTESNRINAVNDATVGRRF
jgi:hypothetical protein